MQKQTITSNQLKSLITLFIIGSSVVMSGSTEVKQDSWICLLASVILALPILLIYARIIKLYPGLDLYDIFEQLFGKIAGKICAFLMMWYALHLGALVLEDFSVYFSLLTFSETPMIIPKLLMLILLIYLVKSGVQVLGKWGLIAFPIVAGMILFTVLISFKNMEYTNILPIMNHSVKEIGFEAFMLFSFPFAEIVLFSTFSSCIKKKDNPYSIYLFSLFAGGIILLIVVLRNIFILGSNLLSMSFFPSFITARIMTIGASITRIEGIISFNFILAGITKISVCLLAVAKGISKIMNMQDYKQMVTPAGLLIFTLSIIVYNRTTEMFNFLKIYPFYSLPFQVFIPVAVWITAEIINRKSKKKKDLTNENLQAEQ